MWLPFGTGNKINNRISQICGTISKTFIDKTGPKNCIGERFAMVQMKVAIVSLLVSFRLEFTADTPKTIQLDKAATLLHSDRGILLKFVSDTIYNFRHEK